MLKTPTALALEPMESLVYLMLFILDEEERADPRRTNVGGTCCRSEQISAGVRQGGGGKSRGEWLEWSCQVNCESSSRSSKVGAFIDAL